MQIGIRRPNGLRYPLVCLDRLDNQARRDNAALTEPTPSHEKCLKTRTLRSSSPTCRVLGGVDLRTTFLLIDFITSFFRHGQVIWSRRSDGTSSNFHFSLSNVHACVIPF